MKVCGGAPCPAEAPCRLASARPQYSQRAASFLLYLNEWEEGGETVFPLEGSDGLSRLRVRLLSPLPSRRPCFVPSLPRRRLCRPARNALSPCGPCVSFATVTA